MDNVNKIDGAALVDPLNKQSISKGNGFGKILEDSIEKVNKLQQEADNSVKKIAEGKGDDIVGTVLALEKADQSLKLMTEVRNKVIAAYNQVMRMQV